MGSITYKGINNLKFKEISLSYLGGGKNLSKGIVINYSASIDGRNLFKSINFPASAFTFGIGRSLINVAAMNNDKLINLLDKQIRPVVREVLLANKNREVIEKIDLNKNYQIYSVGIDKYKYVPRINGGEFDSENVKKTLKDKYGIKTLQSPDGEGKTVSKKDYIDGLRKAVKNSLDNNKNLVLYFSGHGYRTKDNKYLMIMSDTKVNQNKNLFRSIVVGIRNTKIDKNTVIEADTGNIEVSSEFQNAVSHEELHKELNPLLRNGKKVTIILDTCHSGLAGLLSHPNLTIMAASQKTELASGENSRGGYFTSELMNEIKRNKTLGQSYIKAEKRAFNKAQQIKRVSQESKLYQGGRELAVKNEHNKGKMV